MALFTKDADPKYCAKQYKPLISFNLPAMPTVNCSLKMPIDVMKCAGRRLWIHHGAHDGGEGSTVNYL